MDQFKDRIKEKLHNAADRLTTSFNKDAVTNMVSNFGSFINKGMNRLVDATLRNDSYSWTQKTIVGSGVVLAGGMLTTAFIYKKNKKITDKAKKKTEHSDCTDNNNPLNQSDAQLEMEILKAVHTRLLFREDLVQYDEKIKNVVDGELIKQIPPFADNKQKNKNEIIIDGADYLFEVVLNKTEALMKEKAIDFTTAKTKVLEEVKLEMNKINKITQQLQA
jgi:hypothetical protein